MSDFDEDDVEFDFDSLDLDDLDLDFGGVKILPEIPEGEYQMDIVDWGLAKATQSDPSKKKGLWLNVKFKFSDTVWTDPKTGEDHDISAIQPNDRIFFFPDNPFSILPLMAAVKGVDKNDPKALGRVNISDKSDWVGESVIVRLVRSEGKNGKRYLNPVSEAYLPVSF